MTAEVDVNGGGGGEVSAPPKDLPNGNANADSGLFIVNGNGNREGNGAVSSDPVKTDLNSDSRVDVAIESEINNDKQVVELESDRVEENGTEKTEVLHVEEKQESSESDRVEENGKQKIEVLQVEEKQECPVIAVNDDCTEGEVDYDNKVFDSSNGGDAAGNQDVGENPDSGVDTELAAVESGNDQVQGSSTVVSEFVDENRCMPQQIESADKIVGASDDLPVESVCENVTPDTTCEIAVFSEIPVSVEVKVGLEESAPCPKTDVELDAQVVGNPVIDDGGVPGSDTIHTKNGTSETAESSDSQETPELSNSSDIATGKVDPVVEDVATVASITAVEPDTESDAVDTVASITTVEPDTESDPVDPVVEHVPTVASITTVEPDTESVTENLSPENVPIAVVGDSHPDHHVGNTVSSVQGVESEVPEGVVESIENGPTGLHSDADARLDLPGGDVIENGTEVGDERLDLPGDVANGDEVGDVENSTEVGVIEGSTENKAGVSKVFTENKAVREGLTETGVHVESNESKKSSNDSNMGPFVEKSKDSEGISSQLTALESHTNDDSVENGDSLSVPDLNEIEIVSSRDVPLEEVVASKSEPQNGCVHIENGEESIEAIDGTLNEASTATPEISAPASGAKDLDTEVGQLATDVGKIEVVSSRDVPLEEVVASKSEPQNGCVYIENGEERIEAVDGPLNEALTATPEISAPASGSQDVDTEVGQLATEVGNAPEAPEDQYVGTEVVKRPFYCLIKVPRINDDNLKEQIKSIQVKVDEKTRSRDAVRDIIHTIRATLKEYGENLDASISQEKAAREVLKSKRQEIDSLHSVINKVKNARSVEDIDGRIRQMNHMIEHETLPLKEEKQLIREIEQLKQHREQFSSSMGNQDEIQQALDQKDQIEERLKVLRKDADILKENVSKAEAATQAARKKYKDESEKLREFQAQFKAADEVRQEAYKTLQSLRKQAYDKNKYFWNYKDNARTANELLTKGDKEALQHLCDDQVERFLEMWNKNDEFRKEYVKCNINSTLRRLKTLDGRSLGPNEEPPVIRAPLINRVAKDNSASHISTVKEEKPEQVVSVETENVNRPLAKVGVQKDQGSKLKRLAKPSQLENGSANVSGRNEVEETKEEEPKRTKEEDELARKAEELARKAEELRKKEEAAKLKEHRRLEEKEKAKEALERKKRIVEKAEARAALRAQKEAEQKEKEREKRARKKEKKRAAVLEDTSSVTNEEESAPSTETPAETPRVSNVKDKSTTVTKKPQKTLQFTKQTKSKSVPLPLRNRGKRRMQSWMWTLVAALVVFALFLLGNSGFSIKSGLQGFGF